MARVVKEFLVSKFQEPQTISGDPQNEEIFRKLSVSFVNYCSTQDYTHKNQPVIASMLRDVEAKLKMARIDMSTDFENDLAKIIDIQKAQRAGIHWRRRVLPKQTTQDSGTKGEQYQAGLSIFRYL